MGHERAKRFPRIAAVLVAASIALAACAPGGATGSNDAADDGRPSANQPAAAVNGNGSDDTGTGAGDDGRDDSDDEARDDEAQEDGQDDGSRDADGRDDNEAQDDQDDGGDDRGDDRDDREDS